MSDSFLLLMDDMTISYSSISWGVVAGKRGQRRPVNSSEGQRRSAKCFRYHTFPNHFSIPKCAKARLQQSRISKIFRRRNPGPPRFPGKGQGKRETGEGERKMEKARILSGKGRKGKVGRGRCSPRENNLLLHHCL